MKRKSKALKRVMMTRIKIKIEIHRDCKKEMKEGKKIRKREMKNRKKMMRKSNRIKRKKVIQMMIFKKLKSRINLDSSRKTFLLRDSQMN